MRDALGNAPFNSAAQVFRAKRADRLKALQFDSASAGLPPTWAPSSSGSEAFLAALPIRRNTVVAGARPSSYTATSRWLSTFCQGIAMRARPSTAIFRMADRTMIATSAAKTPAVLNWLDE